MMAGGSNCSTPAFGPCFLPAPIPCFPFPFCSLFPSYSLFPSHLLFHSHSLFPSSSVSISIYCEKPESSPLCSDSSPNLCFSVSGTPGSLVLPCLQSVSTYSSRLCTQRSLLAVLRRTIIRMLVIEPGLTACKAKPLPLYYCPSPS